ncbi:MAG: response regulator [Micavibrio aeruginosavorus]|uniref:histidine kinase n=1 Tax=Micavibrio aeruginosavorus TaxID=349221 RepID=A0A7T5R255_9BACT|nr:MAG: response regulator [Micavibrio aeruginosavorus]
MSKPAARKRSKKDNLRDFYEKAPVGIAALRRERGRLKVVYANPALLRMTGRKTSAVFGQGIDALWPGDGSALLMKKLAGKTLPREFSLAIKKPGNPKERWARIAATAARFEEQNCLILWVNDISSSKVAENKLIQQVQQADAAAEMKANFLATMSHEIRTPMQAIYGLLELIGEEKPEQRIRSMVDIAKTSASGLLEILDDILDMAKIDANKMDLDLFEVPVRTLVRGTLEALSVKVHGKDVALIDDIDQDVPFVVTGDPKRLRQIIMNLTGNALKFTDKGSITVHVKRAGKAKKASPNLRLRFEITDTGIGMSEEVCARLFQPFSQADNSTSRKYGGTGLGLSICRRLVDLMGGDIGVNSAPGKGSTFWFEIPTTEVDTTIMSADLPSLEGISVLSVEDHPQGAKEIVRSLASMGAKVESCPTYKEGLELVKRRPFDVAVIDQGLPDGLGLDLIREVMDIRPYMGLIMYTVRDDIGMQHTLQSLGVTYLAKPASRIGLGTAVKDAALKTARVATNGPTRLLIAEDTASVRDVLRRQLEKLAIEADFVDNGREALTAYHTGQYGIIITDLHMPEMDGYDLVSSIRTEEAGRKALGQGLSTAHLPVIVLTADVQMSQRQVYLSHGFDECLLKPVSLGQFRRLLIRWGLLEHSEEPETVDSPPKAPIAPSGGLPPAIDKAAIRAQMGALDQGTIDMLGMFIEMTAPQIAELKDAQAHLDFIRLKELAHSLKGSSRSACCNVLGDIAAELQTASEEQRPAPHLVTQIEEEFARARAAVGLLHPED